MIRLGGKLVGGRVLADLRSDTVTRPTAAMQKAMIDAMTSANLGDDVIDGDGTIRELEAEVAELCGKEAGLYCASGTMTNQLALSCLLTRLESVICDARAHIFTSEAGGTAFHSQSQPIPISLPSAGDHLTVEQVRKEVLHGDDHYATTRVVAIENTLHGMIYPKSSLDQLAAFCSSAAPELTLHLDGARLWNAAVVCNPQQPSHYLQEFCRPFKTVSLCLSKGLGCPVGSVLVGPSELIRRAKHMRKSFGGGWRQAGFLAAAGRYAVKNHVHRLADDHARAGKLAAKLVALDFELVGRVDTNMVFVHDPHGRLLKLRDRLFTDFGIVTSPSSEQQARFVTHLMIDDEQLTTIMQAFDVICTDIRAGRLVC